MEHFSEIMEQQMTDEVKEITNQSDELYSRLVADISKDVSSEEIQNIVREIDLFMRQHTDVDSLDENYWKVIIDAYSGDYVKAITDTKYGQGAADFIAKAFKKYFFSEK